MKIQIFLISYIISFAFGSNYNYGGSSFCTLYDGNYAYYFTSLSLQKGNQAYMYSDKGEIIWYFNVCGEVNGLLDENGNVLDCGEDANICFTEDKEEYIMAATDINKSKVKHNPDSISMSFKDGEECSKKEDYDVTMIFTCDFNTLLEVTSIDLEEKCEPIIYINSSYACARESNPPPVVITSSSGKSNTPFSFEILIIIGGGILICMFGLAIHIWNRRRFKNMNKYEGVEMRSLDTTLPDQLPVMGNSNQMDYNNIPQQIQYTPPQIPQFSYDYPVIQAPQYMENGKRPDQQYL